MEENISSVRKYYHKKLPVRHRSDGLFVAVGVLDAASVRYRRNSVDMLWKIVLDKMQFMFEDFDILHD